MGAGTKTLPAIFSGVAIETFEAGKVTGRWFIGRNHPIARRLLRDLEVRRDTNRAKARGAAARPRLRMAKATRR